MEYDLLVLALLTAWHMGIRLMQIYSLGTSDLTVAYTCPSAPDPVQNPRLFENGLLYYGFLTTATRINLHWSHFAPDIEGR
jgi:hypothetical protein